MRNDADLWDHPGSLSPYTLSQSSEMLRLSEKRAVDRQRVQIGFPRVVRCDSHRPDMRFKCGAGVRHRLGPEGSVKQAVQLRSPWSRLNFASSRDKAVGLPIAEPGLLGGISGLAVLGPAKVDDTLCPSVCN